MGCPCLGVPLYPDMATLKWDGPYLGLTPPPSWGLIKSKDLYVYFNSQQWPKTHSTGWVSGREGGE